MEQTRIRLAEVSVGWQIWQISGPTLNRRLAASWVASSSLDAMLRVAIDLHTYRRDGCMWSTQTSGWVDLAVTFQDEPETYRLVFDEPQSDDVPYNLYLGGRWAERKGELLGHGTVNLTDLASDLVTDCIRLLSESGIVGFREQWQSEEFPMSLFLCLRQIQSGGEPVAQGFPFRG